MTSIILYQHSCVNKSRMAKKTPKINNYSWTSFELKREKLKKQLTFNGIVRKTIIVTNEKT